LLKAIVIFVKVLLNICKLVLNKTKMHELCRTIFSEKGYKDINLFKVKLITSSFSDKEELES